MNLKEFWKAEADKLRDTSRILGVERERSGADNTSVTTVGGFTEDSKKSVAAYRSEINSRIKTTKENKEKLEIDNVLNFSEERKKEIDKLIRVLVEYNNIIGELELLSKSNQVYKIIESKYHYLGDIPRGAIVFDFETGILEVFIPPNYKDLSMLAHELKHAYQFEVGTYSSGPKNPVDKEKPNLLYDRYDEEEAFARGALFGQEKPDWSAYSFLVKGPIDVNHIIPKGLDKKNIDKWATQTAKSTGHAFRTNGQTYYFKRKNK